MAPKVTSSRHSFVRGTRQTKKAMENVPWRAEKVISGKKLHLKAAREREGRRERADRVMSGQSTEG